MVTTMAYVYDIDDEARTSLTGQMFSTHPSPDSEHGYACHVVHGTSEWSNLGRWLELSSFGPTLGDTADDFEREYGRYEDRSLFLIVSRNEVPLGVVRLIRGTTDGNKTVDDLASLFPVEKTTLMSAVTDGPFDNVWDIGTAGILPSDRGEHDMFVPFALLLRAGFVSGERRGATAYTVVVDQHAKSRLEWCGVLFHNMHPAIPNPFPYITSTDSYALSSSASCIHTQACQVRDDLRAAHNQDSDRVNTNRLVVLEMLTSGRGLDELIVETEHP